MLPGDRERIERGDAGGTSCGVHINVLPQTTKNSRFVSYGWKHTAEKQKLAGLNRGHLGAEWGWCGRELDSQLPQPPFRRN